MNTTEQLFKTLDTEAWELAERNGKGWGKVEVRLSIIAHKG